jgi:hypothetical protein
VFVHLDVEVGLVVCGFSLGLILVVLPFVAVAGIVAIFVAVRTTFALSRFAIAGLRSGGSAFVALRAFSLRAASAFGLRRGARGARAVARIRTTASFSFLTVVLSPTTFSFLTVAGVFQTDRVVADCFL